MEKTVGQKSGATVPLIMILFYLPLRQIVHSQQMLQQTQIQSKYLWQIKL
jgi:hypothetical protein